jgi:hypothetical protein
MTADRTRTLLLPNSSTEPPYLTGNTCVADPNEATEIV